MRSKAWPKHVLHLPNGLREFDKEPVPSSVGADVESWLSAIFQAEHLSLLLGSGFTTGLAQACATPSVTMTQCDIDDVPHAENVKSDSASTARRFGRGEANIEDQIRTINQLIRGLEILNEAAELKVWQDTLDDILSRIASGILSTEREISSVIEAQATEKSKKARHLLSTFLLSFASRSASRERLNIFTTNYDRLVEFGCDLIGLRTIDRFVGGLSPIFRPTRLDIDMHYNPPGIRGEPRYLEGVIRLTKLHGSIDWRFVEQQVRRLPLEFGADAPKIDNARHALAVYPNANKDIETSLFPYSELFRDFSAAICRPNTALVTYGYGFGDSHINQVISGMLTIPSTHLAIISYDAADGRIQSFCESEGRPAQISLLVGNHFGSIENLVSHYLPKPSIDQLTWRRADMIRRRQTHEPENAKQAAETE